MFLLLGNNFIMIRRFFLFLVFSVAALQILVFVFHIFSDLKVKNEYIYLNQKTIMRDGSIVDNVDFENTYLSNLDLHENYAGVPSSLNVFNSGSQKLNINRVPDYRYVPVGKFGDVTHPESKFHSLSRGMDRMFVLNPYEQREITYAYSALMDRFYADCANLHAVAEAKKVYDKLSTAQRGAMPLVECEGAQDIVIPLVVADSDEHLLQKIEFIEKNIDEKYLQVFDRYYFHEVPFVLSPILQMKLGRPYREIFSQYGFLSVLGISALMDFWGGLSFPNYEKSIKFSYLAYYVIFLTVVWSVFAQTKTRALFLLFFSLGFFANSYYFYQYPPGHAPVRHFFDFVLFYCVWRYDHAGRLRFFLLGALTMMLSIFTDRDFGLMLAAAFCAAAIYYGAYQWLDPAHARAQDRKTLTMATMLALAGAVLSLWLYPLAANPSSRYFLDGFYSFPVPNKAFAMVLFSILTQALVVLFGGRWLYARGRLLAFLFAAFYSQLLYFYFVWGGGHAHFFPLLIIYVLPYMLLLEMVDWNGSVLRRFASGTALSVVAIFMTVSALRFWLDYQGSQQTFRNHVTYQWNLPAAKGMIGTVDPAPFVDATVKIQKHVSGNRVFMISKYDNLLSILARKYAGTEFHELRSMMVTEDDYQRVKSQLQDSEILFIDNDIDRDFDAELSKISVWNMYPPFFIETRRQRIPKLEVLRRLYRELVPGNYELLDKGALISVYRKTR